MSRTINAALATAANGEEPVYKPNTSAQLFECAVYPLHPAASFLSEFS